MALWESTKPGGEIEDRIGNTRELVLTKRTMRRTNAGNRAPDSDDEWASGAVDFCWKGYPVTTLGVGRHSQRREFNGSVCMARRAGTKQANSADISKTAETPKIVSGSLWLTPYSK
jgi:hypothetical protein